MSSGLFNRLFNRFFPVPNFLRARSFGLDISDESLKFLELITTKNGIEVGRHGERSIPPGVVESGKIKDPKRLEEVLPERNLYIQKILNYGSCHPAF